MKRHFGIIMAIYLVGLAIGGLYVGMVAPVRTVIQLQFGIDDSAGIWMINVYTIFYAAFIPVIGKLADRAGRKRVFTVCVGVFALGCLLCGASAYAGGFALLLTGRVVQAIGGCGMIPVANAEMGTAFPPEKRGMALGLAAAVIGIANVVGAAAGSLVMDLVGQGNWSAVFFWVVPVCVVLVIASAVFLENTPQPGRGKLDVAGAVFLVLFVFLLLMGVRTVSFSSAGGAGADTSSAFAGSAGSFALYLAGAIACAIAFRFVEKRAEDPIFHMEYLRNKPIVITMASSFFIGCLTIMMSLVPEVAEAFMGSAAGKGGYFVTIVGVFSMLGPLVSGKLLDRFGAKPVLIAGLSVATAGYLLMALVLGGEANGVLFGCCLAVVGIGLGLALGAPTNYMILENTDPADSNSAIATVTLTRHIGTSLAPAVYVSFVTESAGIAGYQHMMLAVAASAAIAAAIVAFYRVKRTQAGSLGAEPSEN